MKSIGKKISLGLATLMMAFQLTAGVVFSSLPSYTPTLIGIGVVAGTLPLTAAVCSKDQLVASAEDVLSVLSDQTLIKALQTLSPPMLKKIEGLVPTAKDLITAIKNGDTTNALALVNTIFPVIEEAFALFSGGNPAVLAVLALANIALHFIIDHVQKAAPATVKSARAAGTQGVAEAIDYGAKPVWGCQYRQDKRCAALAH